MHHKGSLKNWWGKLSTSFLFILVFGLTFSLLYRLDGRFRVSGIQVLGEADEYPFKGKEQYDGQHIWSIDPEDVHIYLKNANPYYRIVHIEKKYPSTIQVEVSRLVPSAYLQVAEGYFLLSREGIILEKVREIESEKFPLITFYQHVPYTMFQRGDEIGFKEVKDTLYFLEIIHSARLKVNSIDIEGFHMLGLYTEEGTFLFSSEKDSELQKYQFEQSLKQLSVEGVQFDTLDVRFEKPIVRL